ncbi:MAG TPA: DUF4349 domain-containing protein [Allosphingosinicella sp.]
MRRPLILAAALAAGTLAVAPVVFLLAPEQVQVVREDLKMFDVESPGGGVAYAPAAVEAPSAEPGRNPVAPDGAIAQTAPRIAYTYGYRFRLPSVAVAQLQERHLGLCRQLGDRRCRVLSMRRGEQSGGGEEDAASAALALEVAAPLAARFGAALTQSAGNAGGETIDRTIAAEDLSRQMVDTEARIRTRETLIRRLSALLETRSGNIEQAVQAERAINQAQEELDSARTWLAEMRGRVAMSKFEIGYDAVGATAVPERNAFAAAFATVGTVTVQSLAVLVLIGGLLAPWATIGLLIWLAVRRHRRLHPVES